MSNIIVDGYNQTPETVANAPTRNNGLKDPRKEALVHLLSDANITELNYSYRGDKLTITIEVAL